MHALETVREPAHPCHDAIDLIAIAAHQVDGAILGKRMISDESRGLLRDEPIPRYRRRAHERQIARTATTPLPQARCEIVDDRFRHRAIGGVLAAERRRQSRY